MIARSHDLLGRQWEVLDESPLFNTWATALELSSCQSTRIHLTKGT